MTYSATGPKSSALAEEVDHGSGCQGLRLGSQALRLIAQPRWRNARLGLRAQLTRVDHHEGSLTQPEMWLKATTTTESGFAKAMIKTKSRLARAWAKLFTC